MGGANPKRTYQHGRRQRCFLLSAFCSNSSSIKRPKVVEGNKQALAEGIWAFCPTPLKRTLTFSIKLLIARSCLCAVGSEASRQAQDETDNATPEAVVKDAEREFDTFKGEWCDEQGTCRAVETAPWCGFN